LHFTQDTGLCHIGHVDEDIVSRVTVQWSAQTFLVEVVPDETDAASQNEQAVQCTDLCLFVQLAVMLGV
jgi:hypothetical protein